MLDCFWEIWACTFRIYGHFDHTEFRYCALDEANKLGVKGYIRNIGQEKLIGQIQAPLCEYNDMKFWLRHRGNQDAIIEETRFFNERLIGAYTFPDFKVYGKQRKNRAISAVNASTTTNNTPTISTPS
ncbi:acylphosphatase-2-like [Rhynchophorus ferrugineus]|uniref:acylphosphatase n=1 Tax=Rhynchophorus ferrugineus TaxID=354439 RepID=A0A834MFY7_RHYFE|nr:hypothetical protein GWI33_005582 [Rhynchophorus ferrugineus]